ncbi:hypothetical protein BD413DRAFT_488906 [Trametes elegans]|nr:hypothetical protein BD413DRAFT_488906 [Trametes elegans]
MLASTDPASAPGAILLPLIKLAALLATGYAVHRALSPPNPPPAPKTCIDDRTLFERAIRHVTFCSKMLTWVIVLCDALATLHLAAPTPLTRPFASLLLPPSFIPRPAQPLAPLFQSSPTPSPAPLSTSPPSLTPPAALALLVPHPLLLLGAWAAVCGGALRLACFRALGTLFTFELTISPTHTLVTDGPYAVVRHPSYAGVYAVLLGASAVMLAPGAWLRDAWLAPGLAALARSLAHTTHPSSSSSSSARPSSPPSTAPGAWDGSAAGALLAWAFVAFWTAKVLYALRSTNRRVATEDAELHRVFGAQWEDWAARVRWKLVPWVF